MTAPEDPRTAAWSRRRVLGALAPVPLLAAGGCADDAESREPEPGPAASGAVIGSGHLPDAAPRPSLSRQSPQPRAAEVNKLAGPVPVPATPEVSHAPAAGDAVALTFHGDGPAQLAIALLSEAEQVGARLTVLAVGQWLARSPQMAERVLKGGHELGNHTENHLAIDRMSEELAFSEIDLCAQRLKKLTGSRGRWFRQSQGQHASPEVRAAANRAGYGTLLSYNLDPLDYRDPGATAIVRNVLGKVRAGDVVSMHLGHPETVVALPDILEGLRKRGLRAVTASELFPISDAAAPPADLGSTSQPPQKH